MKKHTGKGGPFQYGMQPINAPTTMPAQNTGATPRQGLTLGQGQPYPIMPSFAPSVGQNRQLPRPQTSVPMKGMQNMMNKVQQNQLKQLIPPLGNTLNGIQQRMRQGKINAAQGNTMKNLYGPGGPKTFGQGVGP